jgi:hypothetical protein
MNFLSYEKYIDEHNDAHLKEYLEFVSIPSISSMPSHKPDIGMAASWIVKKLKSIGMTTAEIIPPWLRSSPHFMIRMATWP